MRRLVQNCSLAAMALSVAVLAYAMADHAETVPAVVFEQAANSLPTGAGGGAPQPGKPMQVDLATDSTTLAQLSPREREDQYRDWLLYAAVASTRQSADTLSKTFYDLPAIRYGYLRPVGFFDFGSTRAAAIADGDVVALVQAGSDDAQRRDDLAAIADQQRKNLGGAFKRLRVFEYTLDVAHSRAQLQSAPDVAYAALFSDAYGYVERTVGSAGDLRAFLGAVDDLAFVRRTDQGLVVGGRKSAQPRRTIDLQHVATLWQAQKKIKVSLDDWDSYAQTMQKRFEDRWSQRTYSTEAQHALLTAEADRDAETTKALLKAEAHRRHVVPGIGFSLDPNFDFPNFQQAFDRQWPALSAMLASEHLPVTGEEVSQGLANGDPVPFMRLRGAVRSTNPVAADQLEQLQFSNAFQAARYDGDLQGTEVGMVLFYTDLIAKLWAIDYVQSSPSHRVIREFVSHPMVRTSLAYAAEAEGLPNARLWFGPATSGYAIADDGDAMYFSRSATRIFSAGSNPEKPNEETQTSSFLAAPIDWWNDHYAEVATFEPEYQRLNEIMKWSALVAWFGDKPDAQRLAFLQQVPVDHSQVFPDWVRRHPELRFQQWNEIGFHPAGYKGATTESLPLLIGPVTAGGVSLADRELAKQPAIGKDLDMLLRRSQLDYGATTNARRITTLDKSTFAFEQESEAVANVTARAREGLKLRATNAELGEVDITSRFKVEAPGSLELRVDVAGEPLGELHVAPSSNGFNVGWRARDVDRAQLLGRFLSASAAPEKVLQRDSTVEAYVRIGNDDASYLVKLRGSQNWIRYAAEKEPRVALDPEWELRVAGPARRDLLDILDPTVARRVMQLRVLDDAQLHNAFDKGHLVIDTKDASRTTLRWSEDAAPADTRFVAIDTPRGPARAGIDADGAIHVDGLPPAESLSVARSMGESDIAALRAAAAQGQPKASLAFAKAESPVVQALERHDYRDAARRIAADPKAAGEQLSQQLAQALKHNDDIRAQYGPAEALHDLDALVAIHGPTPELMLKRGLLQIERGNVDNAVEMAATKRPQRADARTALFDEITALLHGGSASGDDVVRYAQFVSGRDRALGATDAAGDFVPRATEAGTQFDFDFKLRKVPADAVPPSQVPPDAIIYYQDTTSLNNVDWSPSMEQALSGIVDGRLGRVVRLPEGDVADYRPTAIWSPDQKVEFKPARPLTRPQATRMPRTGYRSCDIDPQTGSCKDDRSSTGMAPAPAANQRPVYLVVASR